MDTYNSLVTLKEKWLIIILNNHAQYLICGMNIPKKYNIARDIITQNMEFMKL